ncbi:MAG: hypothetical protein HOQ28_16690 [Thermoleophilia bacterium]|nr:hypothetical protein [Thermoleophilia bacterium]
MITPTDLTAEKTGRNLMSGNVSLARVPWHTVLGMTFRLRKEYVPRDARRFRQQLRKTAAGDDTGYQKMAAAVTHQDFFEFLNHKYLQKSTNALHNKFCENGLAVMTGDGHVFRVYGDENMLKANSAAGVKHSSETAHMSRDAILSLMKGQTPAQSTADILKRLPNKVKMDGAPAYVDLQMWHNPAANDQLRNYCETVVFPGMGGEDKFVGFTGLFGGLSKLISRDYGRPHGAEAF